MVEVSDTLRGIGEEELSTPAARAAGLLNLVRQHEAETQVARRPALPVMRAFAEAGLLRILAPRSYGGEEATAIEQKRHHVGSSERSHNCSANTKASDRHVTLANLRPIPTTGGKTRQELQPQFRDGVLPCDELPQLCGSI